MSADIPTLTVNCIFFTDICIMKTPPQRQAKSIFISYIHPVFSLHHPSPPPEQVPS